MRLVPACWTVTALLLVCPWPPAPALAQEPPEEPHQETTDDREGDTDDTPDVDTDSTIDDLTEDQNRELAGDLRGLYDSLEVEDRDGETLEEDSFAARFRVGLRWKAARYLRLGARIAGRCLSEECEPEFVMERATPAPNGLKGGQVTFDQLYLHWHKRSRFDMAVGRLQTRFVLRGGVFARSLDRNDSNNSNVTWTDGLHATYRGREWDSHFVLQRNSSEGSGSVRRAPLDFDSSSARSTFFLGFENTESWGPIAQRAFDISYLPSSLLVTGDPRGPREDYWGLVGRLAFRWPQRSDRPRLRAGLEAGYAPETQASSITPLAGVTGTVDGLAWDVVASVMDFSPGHSIGVNYAQTAGGWLISPQYRPNEELFELRYQWRARPTLTFDARVRWREDLESLAGVDRNRETVDFFVRLTWQFQVGE
jgi:hypothetical protein